MRRLFRPSAPTPLEGRVVPSAISTGLAQLPDHASAIAVPAHKVRLSSAEIAQSNASDASFGMNVTDTLHSGQPIAERVTTTYSTGTPQTESFVSIADASNNSVTTYKTINLRNNGGTETIADTETFSGGTVPFSGTNNTHTIRTTLPNGTTETATENVVIHGKTSVFHTTIHEADGGVETWTSTNIKRGARTTANKTITEANGTIEHQKTVTTDFGDLDSTARKTTTLPGEILVTQSATDVTRIQPKLD